jgi:hypothetical protein
MPEPMTTADPWHLIVIWDIFAVLIDQGKSVELQHLRSGEHNIKKPTLRCGQNRLARVGSWAEVVNC